jgi:hypothetical protein
MENLGQRSASRMYASEVLALGRFASGVVLATMNTVKGIADMLQITEATVCRWITTGKIDAEKAHGQYTLIRNEKTNAFLLQKLCDRSNNPPKAWNPKDIKDYSKWHDLLDEMTWLLKVCYSSTGDIKKKNFRLDYRPKDGTQNAKADIGTFD